jgi:predicted transcriptional regulator
MAHHCYITKYDIYEFLKHNLYLKQPDSSIEDTSRKGIRMTLEIIENSSKRRDKLIIMSEIIDITKKGTSKTQIMFRANLSFSQLNQYISLLVDTGLIEKNVDDGRAVFQATAKGLEFLQRQQSAIDLLSVDYHPYRNCIKTSASKIFNINKKANIFLTSVH